MTLEFLPSPGQGVWHLGPFPVRAYAICIILGVVAGIWLGNRRWVARGGEPGAVGDIALWAVPFGIVGGRLYHVVTDPELYFTAGKDPWSSLYIWRGGLGIWGAVALGALGAYIGCRRRDISLRVMADVLAPALALGQAIGRWGNWFNQELFGRPTTAPWGLRIDAARRPTGYEQYATFQPTFLYESLWDLALVVLLLWVDRRFKVTHGRLFALYVMVYTLGRGWIEYLRIDTANHFWGLRLNDWTSLLLFLAAGCYFILLRPRVRAGDETLAATPTVANVDGDLGAESSAGLEARRHTPQQDRQSEDNSSSTDG